MMAGNGLETKMLLSTQCIREHLGQNSYECTEPNQTEPNRTEPMMMMSDYDGDDDGDYGNDADDAKIC